jgi:hypothetical protein
MAKDPAFLFYSQDFIVGTMLMSFEDRGKYITLLSLMHQKGRLNEVQITQVVDSISDDLRRKFKVDTKGQWYNERLEKETFKRNKYTESRRNNGKKGGRPLKNLKQSNNHMENHMENEIENEIKDKNEIEYPFESNEFIKLWELWKEYKKTEYNFTYKSKISEQGSLMKLSRMSNGDEKTALKIIKQSIENSWKGFFKLNNNNNGSKIANTIGEIISEGG